jgi:hypothetical protein
MATDHGHTGMICAVFHDRVDGEWIGAIAAATILGCFISQFSEFKQLRMILNVSLFEDFHIHGALREIPLALLRYGR